ncbi:head decoration protein [Pelagibacterium sp.]|uniref:head decoration protein n=1 Tax=Pelagibacterium sp. TaxID=1967288 RepID=UPI003A947EB9
MFTEPKRAGQYLMQDSGEMSYDGGRADATVDLAACTIVAERTADNLIVAWDPTNDDGSEVAIGVFDGPNIKGTAGASPKRVSVCKRWAAITFHELVVPEDIDIDDVRGALPNLVVRD